MSYNEDTDGDLEEYNDTTETEPKEEGSTIDDSENLPREEKESDTIPIEQRFGRPMSLRELRESARISLVRNNFRYERGRGRGRGRGTWRGRGRGTRIAPSEPFTDGETRFKNAAASTDTQIGTSDGIRCETPSVDGSQYVVLGMHSGCPTCDLNGYGNPCPFHIAQRQVSGNRVTMMNSDSPIEQIPVMVPAWKKRKTKMYAFPDAHYPISDGIHAPPFRGRGRERGRWGWRPGYGSQTDIGGIRQPHFVRQDTVRLDFVPPPPPQQHQKNYYEQEGDDKVLKSPVEFSVSENGEIITTSDVTIQTDGRQQPSDMLNNVPSMLPKPRYTKWQNRGRGRGRVRGRGRGRGITRNNNYE